MNKQRIGLFTIVLGRSMRRIHEQSTEIFRHNGLTMPQFTVLEALYHKGELTVQSLIDLVLSTSGNMTVVVHNLEKSGFVMRKENPADRRSCLISLTPQGTELISRVFPQHMKALDNSLSVLTDEELATATAILSKLLSQRKENENGIFGGTQK